MGKGSGRRPTFVPQAEYEANYERIFGKKEKVRWQPPPLQGGNTVADTERKDDNKADGEG